MLPTQEGYQIQSFSCSLKGKVTEKMVGEQLQKNFEGTDQLNPFQSSFRTGQSTENAMIALVDDLWKGQDGNSAVYIQMLLDLSAMVSAINHTILLE